MPKITKQRHGHGLAHNAELLWQLTFDAPGSAWSADDVLAGTADVYLTNLASDPRYVRLGCDGRPVVTVPTPSLPWDASVAHVFPAVATTFVAYRYYALTVSVGLLTGSVARTLQIQEFQPLVEAPPPATAPDAALFGRTALPTDGGLARGGVIVIHRRAPFEIRLSRAVPDTADTELGYLEIWDRFQTFTPYHQGQAWSLTSFPMQPSSHGGAIDWRGVAALSEVLMPRSAALRYLDMPIMSVPWVWCFVRHRALRPMSNQSAIVYRRNDPERSNAGVGLRPPTWVNDNNTLWFQLAVPSARLPGESRYVGLQAGNTVAVAGATTAASSLRARTCRTTWAARCPNSAWCCHPPGAHARADTGDTVDFAQYDANIPLPAEVPPDEWSNITLTLNVQVMSSDGETTTTKRSRRGES